MCECVCVYQLLPWKLPCNLVQSLSVLLQYSYVKVADYLFPKSTIITSDNTVTKSLFRLLNSVEHGGSFHYESDLLNPHCSFS